MNDSPSDPRVSPPAERHVFVSFASEDLALADHVLDGLERSGLRGWIAHRDIPTGASYPAAIRAAVESSGALLLLLTAAANASPHVLREIEMAFNARVPILPVRIAGQEPSPDLLYFLSTTQWFDAGTGFDEDDSAHVHAAVRALLHGRGQRTRLLAGSSHGRRRVVVAAAALLVLIGAVIVFVVTRPDTPDGETASRIDDAGRDIRLSEPPAEPAAVPPPAVASPPDNPVTPKPAPAASGPRTRVNPADGLVYVWIPPGTFTMGCSSGDPACEDDEKPVHAVTIPKGFWLGRTEVTAAAFARRSGTPGPDGDGSLPASEVTWEQAKTYCTAVGGRLPTEAEWEYAARAGTTTRFYDTPSTIAWYEANSSDGAHPVGMKAPNAFGLHDMLGNVGEWVRDRYFNAYDDTGEEQDIVEPTGPSAFATVRGGSWFSDSAGIRASRRLARFPDDALPIVGFRCAWEEGGRR